MESQTPSGADNLKIDLDTSRRRKQPVAEQDGGYVDSTNVSMLWSGVIGLAVTVVFYLLLFPISQFGWTENFWDRGWVPYKATTEMQRSFEGITKQTERNLAPEEAEFTVLPGGSGLGIKPHFIECTKTDIVLHQKTGQTRVRAGKIETDANLVKLFDEVAGDSLAKVIFLIRDDELLVKNLRKKNIDVETQMAQGKQEEEAEQILATNQKRVMNGNQIDPEKFIEEFARKKLRHDFFEIKMTNRNGRPRLVLHPHERAGANAQQVARKTSAFYKDLGKLDASKTYIKFFVCSDSYEVYLTARAAVDDNKLFAGWIPVPTGWNFAGDLGGPIYFGPKPKPPPPPDPNAPKPPPKKPGNEID